MRQNKCSHCSGVHGVWHCMSFKKLDVSKRWEFAKDNKLCFCCLGYSHIGTKCVRSRECGLDNCKKSPHRLLHANDLRGYASSTVNESVDSRPTARTSPPESAEVSTVTLTSSCENFVALRTVPVVFRHGNRSLQVNALLDDASSRSYGMQMWPLSLG